MTSEEILFLRRADVIAALVGVDTLDCVKGVLIDHAPGRTSLPEEGYLPWTNSEGAYSRSIAMLGGLTGERPGYGMKLINASVSNGMSTLDVGLIDVVYQSARQQGIGRQLSVY